MVLVVYSGQTTTAEIMRKLMMQFSIKKCVPVRILEATVVSANDIQLADTVVIVRGANYLLTRIIRAAFKAGRKCIFYIDDDLMTLFPDGSIYQRYLKDIMHSSDVIWTSNPNLAAKYKMYGNQSTRTAVADLVEPWENMTPYQPGNTCVGILFAGSPAHEPILRKYILPAIRNVYKQEKSISVWLIGYKGTSLDGVEPYIHTTEWFDNAEEYRKYVIDQHMQISLGVIEDSEFGRCKYFNKYLEYTKLGVCGIYSKCEPFTFAVRDGENGLLAENTVEGWTETILRAIEDADMRRSCVEHAQKNLQDQFSTNAVIDRIATEIPELTDYKADNKIKVKYSTGWMHFQSVVGLYGRRLAHPVRSAKNLWGRMHRG